MFNESKRGVPHWLLAHKAAVTLSAICLFGFILLAIKIVEPVRDATEIGVDEHYEVSKALLWANGFQLYRNVWNDQPPLLTVLLGVSFKCFGATIGVARSVAAGFGLSMLVAFGLLVWRHSGSLTAVIGLFCLLASPQVLELSVSPMLEVPAIGTAFWALWPLCKWERTHKSFWLLLSGGLLATALQIKLTAAIVLPALMMQILIGAQRPNWFSWFKAVVGYLAIWSGSLIASYAGLAAIFGTVPFHVLRVSHFAASTLEHVEASPSVPFLRILCLTHAEVACAATVALVLLIWNKNAPRIAFPVVWLAVATLVHLHHRPWWPYYYLHFAVPLAWLSGYAIAELFRLFWTKAVDESLRRGFLLYGFLGAGSLLLALIVTSGSDRLAAEVEHLQELPRAQENVLVSEMRRYANHTRWIYTRRTILAFHAGLLIIPELAVLPSKRFWSGQITTDRIWATVKQYRPEQLLLGPSDLDEGIVPFVHEGYTLVCRGQGLALYVEKSVASRLPLHGSG